MRILTKRPVYSKRWLGRPFILSENGLTWGRYSITDFDFRNSSKDEWDSVATALLESDAEQIAIGFEVLLMQFIPFAHCDYLAEIAALYTYELSKRHLAALKRVDCAPRAYVEARANVAASFEATLLKIFNSAAQVHGFGKANGVRYRQILHGMHDVTIFMQETTCHAAFTPDLILESIADKDDFRLWPPRQRFSAITSQQVGKGDMVLQTLAPKPHTHRAGLYGKTKEVALRPFGVTARSVE